MNKKPFFRKTQNSTTWILLALIILLLGTVILLRTLPAFPAAPPAATSITGQPPPPAEESTGGGFISARLVIGLQIAVFAGAMGYFIGYRRGRRKAQEEFKSQKNNRSEPRRPGSKE